MERPTNNNDSRRENLCGRTFGDYHIERRIGGGATSDVFLATQVSLGRRVALKILKDELASDESYVKRFIQEARAAAKLEHPNIVRVYEVGELSLVDARIKRRLNPFRRSRSVVKTCRFIAQEYVDGMSLASYLRKNKQATVLQTFAILEQIVSALKRASDFNIVHRDVKPENVLIDATGALKVVDFGLARFVDSNDSTVFDATSLTRTGVALGTPLYMSPEQARGQRIDSRSDVYSLGVTAYRALAGFVPFSAETPLAVVLKHLNERPRPLSEIRPDAPKALTLLVQRMLEKNPDDRPNSIDALSEELQSAKREYVASLQTARVEKNAREDAGTTAVFASACDSDGFVLKGDEIKTTSSPSSFAPLEFETNPCFFQSDEERDSFRRFVNATNLSGEWQTNRAKLEDTLRSVDVPFWTRRRAVVVASSLIGALILGGGIFLLKNALTSNPTEPPLAIKRFDSVEEQYVFALQLGTVDAWKSVCEYFPDDDYWNMRAKKQLALIYVEERDVESATEIFQEIAANPTPGKGVEPFGLAGLAWRAACLGDFNAAGATLSELDDSKGYDGLTENILRKTRMAIHWRSNSPDMRNFPQQSPPPFGAPSFEPQGSGRPDPGDPNARPDFRPNEFERREFERPRENARGGEKNGGRRNENKIRGEENNDDFAPISTNNDETTRFKRGEGQ